MIAAPPRTPRVEQVADSYLALLRRFRLRPFRDQTDVDCADLILNELFGRDDLDEGESDYLDALLVFYQKYEDEYCPIISDLITPLDRLKQLMDLHNTTRVDLGRILGDDRAANFLMSGTYEITAEQEKKVADHFGLEPGFLRREENANAEA